MGLDFIEGCSAEWQKNRDRVDSEMADGDYPFNHPVNEREGLHEQIDLDIESSDLDSEESLRDHLSHSLGCDPRTGLLPCGQRPEWTGRPDPTMGNEF